MERYYCYDCEKWFEYDDDYVQERECPNCGRDLVSQYTYEEENDGGDERPGGCRNCDYDCDGPDEDGWCPLVK